MDINEIRKLSQDKARTIKSTIRRDIENTITFAAGNGESETTYTFPIHVPRTVRISILGELRIMGFSTEDLDQSPATPRQAKIRW
jgi:hypothetical protein